MAEHSKDAFPMTRWYHAVDCETVHEDPLVVSIADLKGFSEMDVRSGRLVEKWDPTAYYGSESTFYDGEPDDVLQEHLCISVYSGRLRRTLEEAGISGIQYLPVNVFFSNGAPVGEFAIANMLNLVPALDLEHSDYGVFPEDYLFPDRRGHVRYILRAVLKSEFLRGLDVVRLRECRFFVCVSERFKQVFESNKFTGYKFYRLEVV